MKNKITTSGFTLIEVLVATSIISVVFTTLASIVTVSLRNTTNNTRRIIAAHMADGLQEWVREQRDDDWETFKAHAGTWCFQNEVITGWGINESEEDCPYQKDSNNFLYKRIVTISAMSDNPDVYDSKVEYIWQDTGNINRIKNETYYSQW